MTRDLTEGPITKTMLYFAFPMILGNLLQQLYNVADTLIVGRFLGSNALAAVGSSYTLMTFLTSILLGLCMGSGAVFSIRFGQRNFDELRDGIAHSFLMISALTLILNTAVFLLTDPLLGLLQVPEEIYGMMREYLRIIFLGISAVFLYNFFASLLRAAGNSVTPLIFLAVCALLNIGLDLLFVIRFHWGVAGAAAATVISQFVSGLGLALYTFLAFPEFRPSARQLRLKKRVFTEIAQSSVLTCLQQSVMNLGILMVQGLVNSFGTAVMAAFAAAVKIDSFAYMPVQDFGNAFSTFTAQNLGAGQSERVRRGYLAGVRMVAAFAVLTCLILTIFHEPIINAFLEEGSDAAAFATGNAYLTFIAFFFVCIGMKAITDGVLRGAGDVVVFTLANLINLGIRVSFAFGFAGVIGVEAVWFAVPMGWTTNFVISFIRYLSGKWSRKKLIKV